MTGLRATRLAAFTRNLGLAVDVIDAVAGRLDNDAAVTFLTTGALSSRAPSLFEYRLFGAEGYVLWDVRRDRARIVSSSGDTVHLDAPPLGQSIPHQAPAEHLVEVVLDGATNLSPPDIGLHTAEYDRWYDIHIQEVLALPGFVSAERFEVRFRRSTTGDEIPYSFGVRYEVEGDFNAAWRKLRATDEAGELFSPPWTERINSDGWECIPIGGRVVAAAPDDTSPA